MLPFVRCIRVVASASVLIGAALSAGADEKQQLDPLHPSLRACAGLRNNGERLACYDRAVESAIAGTSPAATPPSPEQMFGLTRRSTPPEAAASPIERDEIADITATVKELRERGDGALFILLDNGQLWQRADSRENLTLRVGDSVKIMRAAFGSFRLVTQSQRFAKVVRVN